MLTIPIETEGQHSKAFLTIQPDLGTAPVADSATDTLTFTSSDGSVEITGDASTDTIDFAVAGIETHVVGPASATDNAIARYDATTGKLIQNSGILISDTDQITTPIGEFISTVSDGASAEAFKFSSAAFSTDGAKMFTVDNNGTESFYVGLDNGDHGIWANKVAVGAGASIDAASIFNVSDTMEIGLGWVDYTGAVQLSPTMNMGAAIKRAAALSANATVTGSAVLPFVSGMLFEVTQSGTGSWGASSGVFGSAPSLVSARWNSTAGSANLGNWGNSFFSGTPVLAGGDFSAGTFNHFEAGKTTVAGDYNYSYGLYVWNQNSTTESAAIFIRGGTVSGGNAAAIIINDSDDAGRIIFGGARSASIYYESASGNFHFDSQEAGTGDFHFLGGQVGAIDGVAGAPGITFYNEKSSGIARLAAGHLSFNVLSTPALQIRGSASGFGNVSFGTTAGTSDTIAFVGARSNAAGMQFQWINNNSSTAAWSEFNVRAGTAQDARGYFGVYPKTYAVANAFTGGPTYLMANTAGNGIVLVSNCTSGTDQIGFYCGGSATTDEIAHISTDYFETKKGRVKYQQTVTASSVTLDAADHIVIVDSSSNAVTINLPAVSGNAGLEYYIKVKDDTNTITVDGNGSETIDGSTTIDLFWPDCLHIICDGTEWWIT